MAIERIDKRESDTKIEQTREEERRRLVQHTETRATQDLAAQRVNETKPTGEERSTEAVSHAHRQNERGAEWQNYADRNEATVPQSIADEAAARRQAEQQLTIAEIQADMMRRSGLVRG